MMISNRSRVLRRAFVGAVAVVGAVATARAEPRASLDAPATVPAGAQVAVKWTGPGDKYDVIGIVPANAPDRAHAPNNAFLFAANPVYVTVPEEPGDYELRYYDHDSGAPLARRTLKILPVTATLDAPATAVSGTSVAVRWTGPNNESDTIGIVPAGAPERAHMSGSDFTNKGSPIHLIAPEQPGDYEVRYGTGQRNKTLARAKLTVVGVAASLEAPASVVAGTSFSVKWKGPGGEFDCINIAKKAAPDRKSVDSDFTRKGNPLGLRAPADVGEYELRYQTGQSGSILARAPLTVTPAQTVPGMIRVTAATKPAAEAGGGVEIILDGSGSMLAKLGSKRRIDIAKRTLAKLTSDIIPAGTPFALRVIGRGADSCQSELDVPFGPLDRASAGAKIAALQAKNGAKTPIGASLEKVATDMSAVQGERLVILVTDGEETCGGDPAKAIQTLAASGVDVRVNIVGFAVDDQKLAATFALWARAGGGNYYDARDAKGLGDAFSAAVRRAFEVTDATKNVVARGLVGGDTVRVLPGTYAVTVKGNKAGARSITVRAAETTTVNF